MRWKFPTSVGAFGSDRHRRAATRERLVPSETDRATSGRWSSPERTPRPSSGADSRPRVVPRRRQRVTAERRRFDFVQSRRQRRISSLQAEASAPRSSLMPCPARNGVAPSSMTAPICTTSPTLTRRGYVADHQPQRRIHEHAGRVGDVRLLHASAPADAIGPGQGPRCGRRRTYLRRGAARRRRVRAPPCPADPRDECPPRVVSADHRATARSPASAHATVNVAARAAASMNAGTALVDAWPCLIDDDRRSADLSANVVVDLEELVDRRHEVVPARRRVGERFEQRLIGRRPHRAGEQANVGRQRLRRLRAPSGASSRAAHSPCCRNHPRTTRSLVATAPRSAAMPPTQSRRPSPCSRRRRRWSPRSSPCLSPADR